jgi:hypothetical protein
MAEKIGKVECKTIARMPRNKVLTSLFTLQVSKNTIQRQDNKTRHIKRNSIVQIEISIGYKRKLFYKNITARFFSTVGIVFG